MKKVLYSRQLDSWQGASERVKGVYMQYMTDNERACNKAKKSIVKGILMISISVCVLSFISGCGQSGKLYLPNQAHSSVKQAL